MKEKIEKILVMAIVMVIGFFAGYLTKSDSQRPINLIQNNDFNKKSDERKVDKDILTAEREIKAMGRVSMIVEGMIPLSGEEKNSLFNFWTQKHIKYRDSFQEWTSEVANDVELEMSMYKAQKLKSALPALEKMVEDAKKVSSGTNE